MHRSFVRGMIIGGLVAASVGMMINSDMIPSRSRRRMMRGGKSILRKTGNLIGDVVDLFR